MRNTGDQYRQTARLFGALAHPTRLRILNELRRGTACVCHLQATLDRAQPTISKHLRILRDSGFTDARRDGVFVYYSLADPRVDRLLDIVLGPHTGTAARRSCGCPACEEAKLTPQ